VGAVDTHQAKNDLPGDEEYAHNDKVLNFYPGREKFRESGDGSILDGSNYRGDGKGECHRSDIKDFVGSDEKLAFGKHNKILRG
jgi:hypothetical protein